MSQQRQSPILGVQVIGVVLVLAGVAPTNVHLSDGQIDHERVDGLLPIKRIAPNHRVVADAVWQVDVVLLYGLHRF